MNFSNAAFELADRRAEQERAAGIERVTQAAARGFVQSGVIACCECGDIIPASRRAAHPNAQRCVDCATFLERASRRRA